jgi:hypothetical protein
MMRRSITTCILTVLLAGCQGPPDEAAPPADDPATSPRLLEQRLELQVGPPADELVPGIVFGYDDCGFVRPQQEGEATRVLNGTAVLEWADADGLEMNLTLRAEGGETLMTVPAGPSPLTLTFTDVLVEWTAAMAIMAGTTLPPGELQRPAQLTLTLEYEGEEPLVATSNC